jgi:xylose isomerase
VRVDGDREPVHPARLPRRRADRRRPGGAALRAAQDLRAIDIGAELGAPIFVLWGGREGVESAAARDPRVALERYREGVDFLCQYVLDQGYDMRFALEAKPNEPRGHIYLPTTGHMLHFIETLAHPSMVGVNPEMAHEAMAGLSFSFAVGQALWAGKLFHVDLNSQNGPRYDQDFRFGAEDLKEAFLTVRLLERSGYEGRAHFDARAFRSEDDVDVYAAFARGCIRNYKILAAKAAEFDADERIRAACEAAGAGQLAEPTPAFSPRCSRRSAAEDFSALLASRRGPPPRARRPADARAADGGLSAGRADAGAVEIAVCPAAR